jgi:hypothetical protein
MQKIICLAAAVLIVCSFYIAADTEYTQYLSSNCISQQGWTDTPHDDDNTQNLEHLLPPGSGAIWQGSCANQSCFLQFDLICTREVNCVEIMFRESYLRQYWFEVEYKTCATDIFYLILSKQKSVKTMSTDRYSDNFTNCHYFQS